MKRSAAMLACLFAAPVLAAPGGQIDSLEPGDYVCELPGDATGPAGIRQDSQAFSIINASSYRAGGRNGTYLLTGDVLTLTSGPKRGQRFHRISDRFLREIGPDGKDGPLRCVRQVVNNR